MPLNSYTCDVCGARNNYVVDTDSDGNQVVECSSCGTAREISYRQLPERVRSTIEDLRNDMRIFEDDRDIESVLQKTDTVDETLSQVEQRFAEAQKEMSAFDHIVKIEGTMEDIASEYISDDTFPRLQGYASSVLDDDGNLRGDWKKNGFSAAVNEVSERLSDSDTSSSHIVSYIQQALRNGVGMDMLTDTNAMKAAGLDKKERFILKQAAKNNQLASILEQVLGGESF